MPENRGVNARLVPVAIALLFAALGASTASGQVRLPTPPDHYESFDVDAGAIALLEGVRPLLDPASLALLDGFVEARIAGAAPPAPPTAVRSLIERVDVPGLRHAILEQLVHGSNVLDVVPEGARDEWVPIVHDALIFFLDRVATERLHTRIADLLYLPAASARGDRLLAFTTRTPTLQKIGQMLARNPDLESEIAEALQTLENSLATMRRDELVEFIASELGAARIEDYGIRFDDEILAEASVGAVIRGTLVEPGTDREREIVFKVVKPYVLGALPEELAIVDELTRYFEAHRDAYDLGEIPLAAMFADIRDALSREIRIDEEQRNLRFAKAYYGSGGRVHVPELYELSTPHLTVMEFVRGVKITDALEGDPAGRRELARRLSDALTVDVIFSTTDEAIFHGDPHAGNVFHLTGEGGDRFRIALLDWGLYGSFGREQRRQLVQLVLGVHLGDAKRVRNNVGALIEADTPYTAAGRERIELAIDRVLERRDGIFETLEALVLELGRAGFATRFNVTLFIKSQLTIAGILLELDPDFDQSRHLLGRASGLVWRELPKHLLYTVWFPAWNSHNYRSMLSNEDVRDVWTRRVWGAFRALGRGIARGFGAIF